MSERAREPNELNEPSKPSEPSEPSESRAPTWADFRAAIRAGLARQLAREAEASRALVAEVVPRVAQAIAEARASGLCRRAWLFGSFAWGEPGERSDVDLLVEATSEPFRLGTKVGLACERDVHVIELERAPESLRERVLREGMPL